MLRVNVGCGDTPVPGWVNIDNSFSVRLRRRRLILWLLRRLGLIGETQLQFSRIAREQGIIPGVATKLPLKDRSAEVIYSSHMFEHLDSVDVAAFLKESLRVLAGGGILRLAIPDLRKFVASYNEDGDADKLVAATRMTIPRPRGFLANLRHLIVGFRHHLWMYDGASLCRRLSEAGFTHCQIMKPGETLIPDPGPLNLREQESQSVYVEAKVPA